MRPNAEYIAQVVIPVGGVRGYNPGDDVPASAVENLGLQVGVHVLPANVNVIPRPAGNARRADWEAYWLGQGLDHDEIDGMTRDQMADRKPLFNMPEAGEATAPIGAVGGVQLNANPQPDLTAEQATEQTNAPEPPSDNAKKPEWVAYATARGMNEQTAKDSTVAQLQSFDYDHL